MLSSQLKVNTKVDVFNPLLNNGSWCIGTIKSNSQDEEIVVQIYGSHATDSKSLFRISDKIEHQQRDLRHQHRYVPTDDVELIRTHWVWLQPTTIENSIAPLNTHNLNHYYLHNLSASICVQSKKGKKCSICGTKCCRVCNIYSIKKEHYCIQCICATNQDIIDINEKKNLFCMLCKSWLTSNNKHNCCRCHALYCDACGITSGRSRFCMNCEVQIKAKKYAKSMKHAIGFDVGMDINNLITSFCLGHIIYCNNIKCYNEISVNNQTELEHGLDSEGNKIYQYKLRRVFASSFYDDCTCFIYGSVRRVFCSECTEKKLNRCIWGKVSHYNDVVTAPFKCRNYDVTHCCKNHAYCGYQSYYWKYARDSVTHSRPRCQYDKDLWINTDGSVKKCKWCYETRGLLDTYCYYDYLYDDDCYYDYFCLWEHDDSEGEVDRTYNESKFVHRKRYSVAFRDELKNKKYRGNKKGFNVWKCSPKKCQKRKSYMKRRKDKKGSYESNKRFKKRYQLSCYC